MPFLNFDTPFELKFLAETGLFEGYASVFHVTDRANDQILPGAFRDSLQRFHEEKRLPPLLWQHDASEPIGVWREMYEDSHGLFVKGELFISDIDLARQAHKLLKENVVTGLSIGYRVQESHRGQNSGVRVLTKLDLLEVSLVTFPANEQARVSSVKKFFGPGHRPSAREFESFLRASGLSHSQAKGVVACGYKALAQTVDEGEDAANAEAMRRFNDSLKLAAADNLKAITEAKESPYDAELLRLFNASLLRAAEDNLIKAGFDPAQPRDPAGASTGGQWTGAGGGGQPLPTRRPSMPDEPGLGHPLSPLDFIGGGVARALKPVAELSIAEASTVTEAIAARFSGSALAVSKYSAKVRQAADAVEEFLGGKPDLFRRNKNGDTVIMKGDKKVRFDIRDPGKKRDGSPDQPHFHLQKQEADGKWKNVIEHRHYFRKD